MLSAKSSDSIDETINLTSVDLDVSDESTETTIELSTGDIVEEEASTINLSSADLEESIDPAPVEEVEQTKTEEGALDAMIKDVESLKETVEISDADNDELSAEVAPTQEDALGNELDMAFQEIVNLGSPKEPDSIPSITLKPISRPSTLEGIIPESEDLLGEITSSTAEGGIKSQQAKATQVNQTVANQVGHPLEDMIHSSVERELSELSNSITQSVREIVQEITPKIVKEIVKKEIDKIKNS